MSDKVRMINLLVFRVIRLFSLTTWKQVISGCKVYSISTMRTLTWQGLQFGNFILIVSTHSKPIMTTVRPNMMKTVKSFYISLLLCLGYIVFASQFSETNFTKLSFMYSYLASFYNLSLDSYKTSCLVQTWAFSTQKTRDHASLFDNSKVGYLKITLALFYDWCQFSIWSHTTLPTLRQL